MEERRLSYYALGRNNNFNLIRFIAATMVIYGHSFPLSCGRGAGDILYNHVGQSLGDLAVNIFFVTSGFLVTKSLLNRGGLIPFFFARILRIYPALITAMLFCVVIIGPCFTSVSLKEFFSSGQTYAFFVHNVLLVNKHIQYLLPGVFGSVPYPDVINGSLWTLPYEIWMYISLAILAAVGLIHKPRVLAFLTGAAFCLYDLNSAFSFSMGIADSLLRFLSYFYLGAIAFVYREKIMLYWRVFGTLLILCIVTAGTAAFTAALTLATAYGVFCCAYLPGRALTAFNKIGDYSYGLYIYAFPVQQAVAAVTPGIMPMDMFAVSFVIILLLAIASWHVIEKPALQYKDSYIKLENWASAISTTALRARRVHFTLEE
jgi:peptidoglycan/LPS O-acetylase OafA/YrhL